MLDYMCQQLEQLDIVQSLPDDLVQATLVINRAMDVRSTFMHYLALHIRHDASPLGTVGTTYLG